MAGYFGIPRFHGFFFFGWKNNEDCDLIGYWTGGRVDAALSPFYFSFLFFSVRHEIFRSPSRLVRIFIMAEAKVFDNDDVH